MLATVKGDVHDIGKNIVGVVLGCNSYEVIDLGVMVPADENPADGARRARGHDRPERPDHAVARRDGVRRQEMERRHIQLPLLIGGATTSKQHTAVKIAPEYSGPTAHVLDASRVVDVVVQPPQRRTPRSVQREQSRAAAAASRPAQRAQGAAAVPYPAALANRLKVDWAAEPIARPSFLGRQALLDVPLEELMPFIDWTFFFAAWELKGRFPAVLDHPQYGLAARELYANARALLDRIAAEKLLTANAVYGFWPAASEGDDIVVYRDEDKSGEVARFSMLRQQEATADGRPNISLADFIAPRDAGISDFIGAFAVTAGLGADALAARFEREHDDYDAILVKALADRLAEAFAAYLHARAREEWGFGEAIERSRMDKIIAEEHRGIRPGSGYPACPDHSEKFKLFDLLEATDIGIELTEHAAMLPAASVSGLYFASPRARYFTVGRLGEDQIAVYARRKGMTVEQVERWVSSNLSYEPARC